MIIDDSASLRQVVAISLRGAGYEIQEAADGRDALDKLKGQKVNLMICDLNMPNLDGIGFVKEVKKMPLYRYTPIIILTTEHDENIVKAGQEAGVKAWVLKPFQPPQMLAAVAKLCLP
ncbi:response regulator [Uliginosibacterium sediminicola]|uniref:Response regulator n=1 Tax=Uliginosibacterium sediminicola TaxID=2024550 RepID=A0ABU9YUQ9_9RHOO